MILKLIYEFMITGLLSVGGGLATLPFLYDIGARTGWYTSSDVLNMIAVSEATPGPLGINMSTYVGIFACIPFCYNNYDYSKSFKSVQGIPYSRICILRIASYIYGAHRSGRLDCYCCGIRYRSWVRRLRGYKLSSGYG